MLSTRKITVSLNSQSTVSFRHNSYSAIYHEQLILTLAQNKLLLENRTLKLQLQLNQSFDYLKLQQQAWCNANTTFKQFEKTTFESEIQRARSVKNKTPTIPRNYMILALSDELMDQKKQLDEIENLLSNLNQMASVILQRIDDIPAYLYTNMDEDLCNISEIVSSLESQQESLNLAQEKLNTKSLQIFSLDENISFESTFGR